MIGITRAVWIERFTYGSVRGLGWNALAYSTCVTRNNCVSDCFVIVWMMIVGLSYTPYSRSVQPAQRCCFQKERYWTFGLKGVVKTSGECNGVECKWTVDEVAKLLETRAKLSIWSHWQEKIVAGGCLLATGSPLLRRQDHYTGVHTKREKLRWQCAIEQHRKASKSLPRRRSSSGGEGERRDAEDECHGDRKSVV